MLTLTRRIGEKIIIDNDIVCTILDVQESHIRLGFVTPHDVKINRKEIHIRKHMGHEDIQASQLLVSSI